MGGIGRAPTPTKILAMTGSWRAASRTGEPQPSVSSPVCPESLTGEARAEWPRVCRELAGMGLLSSTDTNIIAAYCEAWGEFVECCQYFETHARTYESISGPRIHPMVKIKNEAATRVHRYGCELGLTPAARTRIRAKEAEKVDEFEEFLTKKA